MAEPSDELKEEARALLEEGRKIEAIQLVREETGMGLAEAKSFVEALQRGDGSEATPGAASDFEQELLALLRQDKKIEAVKLFREETGASLKEAYDAVRALAARHGVEWRSGCLGLLVLAACGLGAYLLT
ncbi:MAG: ribosomal protein L7/L12 [Gemmataceae bacterium]